MYDINILIGAKYPGYINLYKSVNRRYICTGIISERVNNSEFFYCVRYFQDNIWVKENLKNRCIYEKNAGAKFAETVSK